MPPNPQPRWDGRRYRFQVNGKVYTRRSEKEAWDLWEQLTGGRPVKAGSSSPALTIASLVLAWLEANPGSYREYIVEDFVAWAGHLPLTAVKKNLIERYGQFLANKGNGRRRKGGASLAKGKPVVIDNGIETIRKKTTAARAVFAWAADEEDYDGSTIPRKPKLPPAQPDPKGLSEEQLQKLADDLSQVRRWRIRQYVAFVLATNARPGEARLLRWEDIEGLHGKRPVATLHEHKTRHRTGRSRKIFLTEHAVSILRDVIERQGRHDDGYVFHSKLGRPYTASGLAAILRRMGITAYKLRHTWAQTILESRELREIEIATLMGHSDLRMIKAYATVRDAQAADAASRANAALPARDLLERPAPKPTTPGYPADAPGRVRRKQQQKKPRPSKGQSSR